ncbi:hypothetical protein BK124_18965 [Paenibacillus amylolyticus]|uniref:DUF5677 domain-containing protein n=1 Tax=Paenibacillus amylolyticus TaxID=1451 RepID=UPI00096F11AD|nr:DUF5677 domain-containing protein [Paenibacillus amylolyticus]OME95786.1 hypothetical protein BK124_18965 [Paenibacillus amylolyticus]
MSSTSSHKLLSETIQFSDQLLIDYMNHNLEGKKMEIPQLVITTLYRSAIEYLDAIYVLADHGLEGPASTSMRSFLEVMFSLSYIVYQQDKVEQRAKAYYVGFQMQTKKDMSDRLNNFKSILTTEEEVKIKRTLSIVQKSLNRNEIKDIIKEWKRTKNASGNYFDPKWHSLFNGPESIVKLAKLMQQQDTILELITAKEYKRFHEISYSILSREAHSYAALDKYKMVDDDPTKLQLAPVRTTTQAVMEGSYRISNSISLMLQLNVTLVMTVFPQYKEKLVDFSRRHIN